MHKLVCLGFLALVGCSQPYEGYAAGGDFFVLNKSTGEVRHCDKTACELFPKPFGVKSHWWEAALADAPDKVIHYDANGNRLD